MSYAKLEKQELAEKDFLKAISLEPDNGYNYFMYANYLNELKNPNAKNFYLKALELDPTDFRFLGEYASFLESQKQYNDAEYYYAKSVSLKETSSVLNNYANFLSNHERSYDKVEQLYKRAIELDSNNFEIYTNFAVHLYNHVDKIDEAKKYLIKSLEINPNNDNTLANFAQLLLISNELKQAHSYLQLALNNCTNDSIRLELLFYEYAHFWENNNQVIEIQHMLDKGIRSPKWKFDKNIIQAQMQSHPDIGLLSKLAERISADDI